MVEDQNPFTPGFGLTPSVLAGRAVVIEEFSKALVGDVPGRRTSLISGPRGSGKTVVLTEFESIAEEVGWATITLHTASLSMPDELRGEVISRLRQADPRAVTSRLTGGGVSGVSAYREVVDRYDDEPASLASLLERFVDLLAERGAGLLITVDEIQSVAPVQLHQLAQHVQDLVRRNQPVAFVAAGVSSGIDTLLQDDHTTFLRRAHPISLGSVSEQSAIETIRQTVADTNRTITPDAAVLAGRISQGYPYLIQLVGAYAWEQAGAGDIIEELDVRQAVPRVIASMVRNVHQPALRGMSGQKMAYLQAMAEDEGPSKVADVVERMGKSPQYAGVYRNRLIADGMIRPAGYGLVEFALPYLREALIGPEAPAGILDAGVDVSRPRTRRPRSRGQGE